MTGEGVKLMTAGTGDLLLSNRKEKTMLLDLDNERTTVNGESVLAFEPGIEWDIRRGS